MQPMRGLRLRPVGLGWCLFSWAGHVYSDLCWKLWLKQPYKLRLLFLVLGISWSILNSENLGLPCGKPRIVCHIFKEAVSLHWLLWENLHVWDDWNLFLWHFPLEILVCFHWSNEVSCIMLCYNLSYNQKQKPNLSIFSPHQIRQQAMQWFFYGPLCWVTFWVLRTTVLQSGRMLTECAGRKYCCSLKVTVAGSLALVLVRKAAQFWVPGCS